MENQLDLLDSITKLTRMLRRKPKEQGHHSHSMHKALCIIINNDGMRAADLAVELDIRPSSLTDVLKRLEEKEYVNKVKDENDSRAYQIFATEKAKQEFGCKKQQQGELSEKLKSALTEEEVKEFCFICDKLTAFLESEYPEVASDRDGHGRHHCKGGAHGHDGGKEHCRGGGRGHGHRRSPEF